MFQYITINENQIIDELSDGIANLIQNQIKINEEQTANRLAEYGEVDQLLLELNGSFTHKMRLTLIECLWKLNIAHLTGLQEENARTTGISIMR
jgi:hypothetical protein